MKIILATTNLHKLEEFQNIFKTFGIHVEGIQKGLNIPSPQENGNSFLENSDIKAIYYSGFFEDLVLADDSGLCVDILNGAPGVFSSRFAGNNAGSNDNNLKLLKMMLKENKYRNAEFVCSLSLALKGKVIKRVMGEVKGVILKELKGEDGFGYDPLFYYEPLEKTFSEMNQTEKNKVSHRYHASKNISSFLMQSCNAKN